MGKVEEWNATVLGGLVRYRESGTPSTNTYTLWSSQR